MNDSGRDIGKLIYVGDTVKADFEAAKKANLKFAAIASSFISTPADFMAAGLDKKLIFTNPADFCIDIDLVIITSPLCDTIESYFYRLSKVHFSNEVLLYTLFYKGTLEEKKLEDRAVPINHTIINDFDRNVKVDNNNAYCIVD